MSKLTPPTGKHDHVTGPAHAALTWVEYGDYQCPHCGAAYPIIKELLAQLGDKVKFVYRNFPMSEAHPMAFAAALAAEAAARQDRFWEMHDIIFENQDRLSDKALLQWAGQIGLQIDQFVDDMQDPALEERVNDDFESGIRSGVNGTPSFYINGEKYNGDNDLASLKAALLAHLHHTATR